jgi:hypothetical protein
MFSSCYSFNFNWKDKICGCTLYKYGKHEVITLLFEDYELVSTIGRTVDLYKIEGKMVIGGNTDERNDRLAGEVIAAVEDALRKPLLWMFSQTK